MVGGFNNKTVRDINLAGKRGLLRADYNVPVRDNRVVDDYRLRQSLPTIEYILQQKPAALVIISHLGRPQGKPDPDLSLLPVVKRLSQLLGQPVAFAMDCIGPQAKAAGKITLFENLRFHEEEEKNDPVFAKALVEASQPEVFVQDGFGVVHRAHASTDAITKLLPSVVGLLLEKEVLAIQKVITNPQRPLLAIIGGAKIADKMKVLKKFILYADFVALGGAMANTFLLADGIEVGKSIVDKSEVPLARDILQLAKAQAKKRPFVFYLPQDGVAATSLDKNAHTRIVDWGAHIIAEIENYPKHPPRASALVKKDELILDIGP